MHKDKTKCDWHLMCFSILTTIIVTFLRHQSLNIMKKIPASLCHLGVIALTSIAYATPSVTQITLTDWNGPGGAINTVSPWGWNTGPAGTKGEDNETEYGTNKGQFWDLEGLSITRPGIGDPGTPILNIVGGYDFMNGATGGLPGMLFIKVGGIANFAPLTNPDPSGTAYDGLIRNGSYSSGLNVGYQSDPYGYNYAVDLKNGTVYNLFADTWLQTTSNDPFASNPWKLKTDSITGQYGTHYDTILKKNVPTLITETNNYTTSSTIVTYSTGLSPTSVGTSYGISNLLTDKAGAYNKLGVWVAANDTSVSDMIEMLDTALGDRDHNVVSVNLGFIGTVPKGSTVFFHYTMECGNDMLIGSTSDGLRRVPDGANSIVLIGLGLVTLGLIQRRMRLCS